MGGFFIVARQLFSHWIWTDKEPFCRRAAWIDLIGLANHSDTTMMYRGELIECKRGEVNRSVRWLAERWHWSRGKVDRFLETLEKEKMITITEKSHRKTAITVENYSTWQDMWRENGPQTGHRRATDGPQTGHEQRIKKKVKEERKNIYIYDDNDDEYTEWLERKRRGIV